MRPLFLCALPPVISVQLFAQMWKRRPKEPTQEDLDDDIKRLYRDMEKLEPFNDDLVR